ncbi:MAG: DUF1549 and DUF1553 domain-containing protein [Pirellulales bacterium]
MASLIRIAVGFAVLCSLCTSIAFADDWGQEELQRLQAASQKMTVRIDELINAKIVSAEKTPAALADDGEFLRRAYLDLTGILPSVATTRAYLVNADPDKRIKLIEKLLQSPAYPTHMASTWRNVILKPTDDIQQLQNQFGLQRWLRTQFSENIRYDRLVGEFITATDSDAGPAYFYASLELKPEQLAAETSRIFLGLQMQCAQCHDHPFDEWKQRDFWGYAAFFAQLERNYNQPAGRIQTVAIRDRSIGEVTLPDTEEVIAPAFPGSDYGSDSFGGTRRQQLAVWMVARDNPFMPRRAVNWAWSHLFGRGLVNPVDDLSPQNPPSHPELMEELTKFFVKSGFDIKLLLQTIASTEAYARTSRVDTEEEVDLELFQKMAVKSLSPEQMYDSFLRVALLRDPIDQQASQFLGQQASQDRLRFIARMRTPSDNRMQFETGMPQALALMNGPPVSTATNSATSGLLQSLEAPFLTEAQKIEVLSLAVYSRYPSEDETKRFSQYLLEADEDRKSQALGDVLWAMISSAEFMLNH